VTLCVTEMLGRPEEEGLPEEVRVPLEEPDTVDTLVPLPVGDTEGDTEGLPDTEPLLEALPDTDTELLPLVEADGEALP